MPCSIALPVALARGPSSADATPLLPCRPLHISMARLLQPPPAPMVPSEFFRAWDVLPARAEVSGACAEACVPLCTCPADADAQICPYLAAHPHSHILILSAIKSMQ